MPDNGSDKQFAFPPASSALRWSVTLQALLGGSALILLLVGAALLAAYSVGIIDSAVWIGHPLWAGFRLAMVIPAVATCVIVLRWMRSPIPPPKGIPLQREQAPGFHSLLDRFRFCFDVDRSMRVCITGEMNASIVSRPRGVTLQIGLPLLLSVAPKQCAAILAHEFGHLCIQRNGPGAWTGHVRAWWHRVLTRIDRDDSLLGSAASWLLRRADQRYLEDSLRLSHDDEFEADSWAAKTIGAEPLAEALFSLVLKERFLQEDYLRKVNAQADHLDQPTILPFQQMASALKVGYDPVEAIAAYDDDSSEASEDSLTHPSIGARCAKLAVDPRHLRRETATAAEIYLQPALPRLALELDLEWWAEHGTEWMARHREAQRARRRIARLEQRERRLSAEEKFELASLVENYCAERDPLRLYLDLLDEEAACPPASLAAGRLLIEQGNGEGANHLLHALSQDSEVGLAAAAHLLAYARTLGIDRLEQRALHRARELMELEKEVRQETESDFWGAGWEYHGLDAITLRKFTKALAHHRQIRRCYLVRRVSVNAPLWIAYVLVVRTDHDDPGLTEEITDLAESLVPEKRPVRVLQVRRDSHWEHFAATVTKSVICLHRTHAGGTARTATGRRV